MLLSWTQVKRAISEETKQSKILAYITALKKLCNHPKVIKHGKIVITLIFSWFIVLLRTFWISSCFFWIGYMYRLYVLKGFYVKIASMRFFLGTIFSLETTLKLGQNFLELDFIWVLMILWFYKCYIKRVISKEPSINILSMSLA